MKKKNVMQRVFLFALISCSAARAFAPVNFYKPHDANWLLPRLDKKTFTMGLFVEGGSQSSGYNHAGKQRNMLALHDDVQSSALMLLNRVSYDGVVDGNEVHRDLLIKIVRGVDPQGSRGARHPLTSLDDSRGTADFTGNFVGVSGTLYASYLLPFSGCWGDFSLNAYLPVTSYRVRGVKVTDKTVVRNFGDLFAQQLNQNLASMVKSLSKLDLSPVEADGIGDVNVLFNWEKVFRKERKYFSNLFVAAKIGVSLPTGCETHADKAFKMALGNDGAWGLPFGVGIEAEPLQQIRLGVYADFLALFDETKTRRVKTFAHQSEFLLLNKTRVEKDHGFTWQISPFVQAFDFGHGVSAKLAYQYMHHDNDKLCFRAHEVRDPLDPRSTRTFSFEEAMKRRIEDTNQNIRALGRNTPDVGIETKTPHQIINSARSLKKWDAHNIIVQLNWDVATDAEKHRGAPQFSLFYKRMLSGKNIVDTNTFGGQVAFNF